MSATTGRSTLPWLALAAAVVVVTLLFATSKPAPPPPDLDPGEFAVEPRDWAGDEPLRGEPGVVPSATTLANAPRRGEPVDSLPLPALAEGLTVRTSDERGTPIPGARIVVRPVDPEGLRGAPFPDGEPVAEGLTDGRGQFVATLPRRDHDSPTWWRVVASADDRASAAHVVVAAEATLDLVLGPAGEVRAEVVRATGLAFEPVPNARVTLAAGELRIQQITDENGHATFPGVPIGTAALRVQTHDLQSVEDGPFVVAPGESVERIVSIGRAQRVAGVVLDDADDAPVAGAEVWMTRPGAGRSIGPTDRDGRFGPAVAGSDAERQFIAVRAPGYAPATEPIVLRAADDDGPMEIRIRLRRAAPWNGRVLGPDGSPVEGARVAWSADGVAGRPPASATTDEEGRFTIDPPPMPLPGRRLMLLAEAAPGRAALALRVGEPPPHPLELRLVGDPSVGGRLAYADGTSVVGGEVRLVPIWDESERRDPDAAATRRLVGNERGLVAWSSATDANGRFLVAGVPPGRWQVHARTGALTRWFPDVVETSRRDVDVGTFVVDDGATLLGIVVDSSGRAIAGARIDAVVADVVPRASSAMSDRDGAFAIHGLPASPVQVRARHGDLASEQLRIVPGPDGFEDRVALELPAGGIVRFALRDETGAPIVGVVVFRREPIGGPNAPGRPESRRARDGVVELHGIPAGPAWWTAHAFDGRVARTEGPIDVEAGRRTGAALTFLAPSRLDGTVVAADGRAAAVADVHARHLGGRGTLLATTDVRGRFHFGDVIPGRWLVTAWGRGGAPVQREIDVLVGARAELDLVLDPAGACDVEVLDERGRPVGGALVRFRSGGALIRTRGPARTNERGRARIEDLPLGRIEGHASHPRAGEGRAEVSLESGRAAPLVIRLAR